MTNQEKYKDAKPIGVIAMGLVGIEVLKIEYGINDYVIVRGYTGDIHKVKLYYGDRDYFRLYSRRFYMDECIRVD